MFTSGLAEVFHLAQHLEHGMSFCQMCRAKGRETVEPVPILSLAASNLHTPVRLQEHSLATITVPFSFTSDPADLHGNHDLQSPSVSRFCLSLMLGSQKSIE